MAALLKRQAVKTLNQLCVGVDDLAYRPAVIKLTRRLPGWWHCQLAHLSMRLDERWGTAYWDSENAPAVPGGTCEACGRRPAIFVIGGFADSPSEAGDYLANHEVNVCGWCQIPASQSARTKDDVAKALAEAGERSITWRWRWRPAD